MTSWDWILASLPLIVVLFVCLAARGRVRSVADFMSGNRSAGRYLLAIANGELQSGAVVFAASYEYIAQSGFTLSWWLWLSAPVFLIVGITGFVTFRFRETRAMTLAQFFEIRYSKRFRLFAGMLGFLAGICNFGIIPAVGAQFLVYFLGLPAELSVYSLTIPTYGILMLAFLSTSLFVALTGGVVTILLTNCLEGILSQLFYLVIIAALVVIFPWSHISAVMSDRPPGQSLLNPFDASGVHDFNIWYVLMTIVTGIYGTMAWQNAGAYNAAALSPHEGRMGRLLGGWREMGKKAVVVLLAVGAFTFLHDRAYADQSTVARQAIGTIADSHLRQQMTAPIAWAHILPPGVKGIFCAVLLMGVFGGDATHLHSWGSIFVQDVLVPLRRRPFSTQAHLWILRLSITGVALFAFVFGLLFRQTDYILMWWAATQAIFTGGAGAAIIGGLYWKKGTTGAAWLAMITGSVLSCGGIVLQHIYDPHFPFNGLQISFFATVVAVVVYVVASLSACREDFNLDRMLHRGLYATEPVKIAVARGSRLAHLIGIDGSFTRGDKFIAGVLFWWSMMYFTIFVLGTLWNQIAPWPLAVWSGFWHVVGILTPIFFAVVTGIWFTWGGVVNMRQLLESLDRERIDERDDGMVIGGRNRDE